jgi:hypothetical protein
MKTNNRSLWCFALATLVATACGGANDPSDTTSTGSDNGATCDDRCTARLESCGVPHAQAGDACANRVCNSAPTATQLTCLDSTDCGVLTSSTEVCGIGGGDGGGTNPDGGSTAPDAGSTTSDAGSTTGGTCVALGATGCNAGNNPSGCCTDTTHPDTVCFSNADSSLECCVAQGNPCAESSDCCGNADSGGIYKCCPTGLCGAGC